MRKRATSSADEFLPISTIDDVPLDLEPGVVIDERPRICVAIDAALDDAINRDSSLTNQHLAGVVGVSGAAVGRWRRTTEPTRDQLYNLELAIGKRPGYISQLAGYFAPVTATAATTTEQAIEHDARISDTYREILFGILRQAIDGTKAERKRQSEWRRKAGRG